MLRLATIFLACVVITTWAAGSVFAVQVVRPTATVLQAYPVRYSNQIIFRGNLPATVPQRSAAPGFFVIDPGPNWVNYVSAAAANQVYGIKTVRLIKRTPQPLQCSEVYAARTFAQMGQGIRLHWPLMYEAPGTTWTLTILYGTKLVWNNAVVHQDTWSWKVDTTWDSLSDLLTLFHELPFGLDEVPLISDETLYPMLQSLVASAKSASTSNKPLAASYLSDFELMVSDACITASPTSPIPSGYGTGIAQTDENPACCKLLIDAEWLFQKLGFAGLPIPPAG